MQQGQRPVHGYHAESAFHLSAPPPPRIYPRRNSPEIGEFLSEWGSGIRPWGVFNRHIVTNLVNTLVTKAPSVTCDGSGPSQTPVYQRPAVPKISFGKWFDLVLVGLIYFDFAGFAGGMPCLLQIGRTYGA